MKKELCPNCQNEMELDEYIDDTTIMMRCRHCGKLFKLTYDEAGIPNNLDSFNWGAFGLMVLWGFWNGMPVPSCFCLSLMYIGLFFPLKFSILTFVLMQPVLIYVGLKANRWSWKNKEWKSVKSFETAQKVWNIVAIVLLFIAVLLLAWVWFVLYSNRI